MSKKPDKQPMNGNSAPKPAVKNYPAEQHDLDAQQERVRKAAAAGAGTMKVPITASATPQPASPAKPLVSAAASWPSSTAPRADAKATPPASIPQKEPVAAKPSAPVSAPKPAPQSAPPTTPVAAVSQKTAAPQKPAAPKTANVTFALAKSGAKKVSVCGEFNGWSPAATPLKQQPDGHWETKLTLAPGQYQYKFVVDEEWIIDPAAQKSVPNAFGSLNSVVEVRS